MSVIFTLANVRLVADSPSTVILSFSASSATFYLASFFPFFLAAK